MGWREAVRTRLVHQTRLAGVLAGLLSVALAGCQRPSPLPADQARALETRARTLQGVAEASHGGSDHGAVQSLIRDVAAYNASVGSPGAGVLHTTLTRPGSVFLQGGQPACTLHCPGYPPNPPRGRFCFLDGASYCSPLNGVSFCSYTCIFIYPVFGEGHPTR